MAKAIDNRSKELRYHDELNHGSQSALWKALNRKAGFSGVFFRSVAASDMLHNSVRRFVDAAPADRLKIPDNCVVWNMHRGDEEVGVV